ncbi:MAG TPA: M48 family metalloprotease [Oligoflexus sp.]|uniref:M48 family metalloprotease n=1 Tax=Oligoflexus sp. TaxID=1971216 RepID=UPI002D7EF1D8|nr:M48 family metalloprotease [Oligoflexus sp.]HET9237967.1 M48 family metalloprotease [Oligoflexus sp.]
MKHIWGGTLRPPHALNCLEMESFDPFFQKYVHRHIDRIALHNAYVFRDELDATRFCVMPIEAPDIDAGASADGTLIFNSGLIQVADTDAQFAAAVAHELAHITLNHGRIDFAEFVRLRPEYQAEADGIERVAHELAEAQKTLDQSLAAWSDDALQASLKETLNLAAIAFRQEFNRDVKGFDACRSLQAMQTGDVKQEKYRNAWLQLRAQLNPDALEKLKQVEGEHCRYHGAVIRHDYRKRSLLSNWIETEADEAGYEFFLRAGYQKDEYAKFFRNIDRFYGGVETRAEDCLRGEGNHPKDCWRALHAVQEWERHQDSIRELPDQGTHVMVFDQDLAQLMKVYRPQR